MDTILFSNIIKIISIIILSIFSYKMILEQIKKPTSPRKRMILFLLSGIFVISLEFIKTFFNTDVYMIWVAFQHLTFFSASMLHLFMLDWVMSLKATSISNNLLIAINKKSNKFIIIPFIIKTLLMFSSFCFVKSFFAQNDYFYIKYGYLIIVLFFKIHFLFITLLSYIIFPNFKNLKYIKISLLFLTLSRFSNLLFYSINKNDIDDFTKYVFILSSVIFYAIGMIKLLRDKKKSCEETQPFDANCKDD